MMSPSDEVEEVLSKTMEEYSFIILGLIVSPPRCNITETYSCGLPVRKQPLYGFKEKYFNAKKSDHQHIYIFILQFAFSPASLGPVDARCAHCGSREVRGRGELLTPLLTTVFGTWPCTACTHGGSTSSALHEYQEYFFRPPARAHATARPTLSLYNHASMALPA